MQALAYSASRTSKLVQHLHSVFVSTYAVLFLGTPHNGSNKASLASTGRRMIDALVPSKVCDTDGQLLDALQEGSEVLQNITDVFAPLMKNFRIYFFWEQEKTDLGTTQGYVRVLLFDTVACDSNVVQVVEESSAAPILDDTERAGLPYNHRNMCRFESRSSAGYRLIAAALIRYSKDAPYTIQQRWASATEMLRSKRVTEAAELLM
jgi:protein SERAC1